MLDKTLALIMAAGYGRRMGNIDVPKVMLKDGRSRPFIDDALTFLKYVDHSLDFAVMSRDEAFFEPLNSYLADHPQSSRFDVVYQKTKPRSLAVAFVAEHYLNREFRRYTQGYTNIALLPGDHKLTSEDLDLTDLMAAHERKEADITCVYSHGWSNGTEKRDMLTLDQDGRVVKIKRADSDNPEEEDYHRVTSTGIWVFKRELIENPLHVIPALYRFMMKKEGGNRNLNIFPYFIEAGWSGGRDTPDTIGK